MTAEKTLEKFVTFDSKNNNDMIRKDCTINAMEEYGKQKWNEACKKILADISKTFLDKNNLKKSDSINDEIVFRAFGETIINFPIPEYR